MMYDTKDTAQTRADDETFIKLLFEEKFVLCQYCLNMQE